MFLFIVLVKLTPLGVFSPVTVTWSKIACWNCHLVVCSGQFDRPTLVTILSDQLQGPGCKTNSSGQVLRPTLVARFQTNCQFVLLL